MKDLVEKEVTLFVDKYRIKGKAKIHEDESVLPIDSEGEYLEMGDVTVFAWEGSATVARTRFLHVRKSAISMYFLEEYILPKAR